jgi:1,4-dihydroxy-2-naphthoyl-CoA hydrolase
VLTAEQLNRLGIGHFPGHIGMLIRHAAKSAVTAELPVTAQLMAPNGYLHAGSIVTLADTCAGYGCRLNLPAGATGFTTIELKSNFLGTAREGIIECRATPTHIGRTTQVWDATVTHRETGKTLALFRCTQLVLYPNALKAARPTALD